MSSELQSIPDYQNLIDRISETYDAGRRRALQAVNSQLLETYWQIGHDIVEFEQGGKLLRIDDRLERGFYEQQSIKERWSVPELQRQKKSSLFLRLAAGKAKNTNSIFPTAKNSAANSNSLSKLLPTSNPRKPIKNNDFFLLPFSFGLSVPRHSAPESSDAPSRWSQDSIVVSTFPKP